MLPLYLIAAGIALLAPGCLRPFWRRDQYPLDRENNDRKPEASRVKMLEGLTLGDFESILPPDDPDRKEVMQKLKQIIRGSNYYPRHDARRNPARLDPLWETIHAARLFRTNPPDRDESYPHLWPSRIIQEDIDAYQRATLVQWWEGHREKVREEFHLNTVNHPFASLFDRLPVDILSALRGLPVFDSLGEKMVRLIPAIAKSRKLQVLYPGSGFHVAPLLTALRLMDAGIIDEAAYLYTEIDPSHFAWLKHIFERGLGNPFDRVTLEPKREFPGEGSEQAILLDYKGHPLRIVFALNRSGENYYRPEYLKEADLVVIHDPGHGAFTDSFGLLAKVLWDKQAAGRGKEQVLIMEGTRKKYPKDRFGFPRICPRFCSRGRTVIAW